MLPMSRLEVLSVSHSMRIPMDMLQLFSSYEDFHRVLMLLAMSPSVKLTASAYCLHGLVTVFFAIQQ